MFKFYYTRTLNSSFWFLWVKSCKRKSVEYHVLYYLLLGVFRGFLMSFIFLLSFQFFFFSSLLFWIVLTLDPNSQASVNIFISTYSFAWAVLNCTVYECEVFHSVEEISRVRQEKLVSVLIKSYLNPFRIS